METTKINDHGVVYKKVYSQYHVRVGGRSLPCGLSAHLHENQTDASIAIGDHVRFSITGNQAGIILDVLPRRNRFSRPAPHPGIHQIEQVIAANIDLVVPVFATANPAPKWGLLDRYLVAAEAAGLETLICITKLDLARSDTQLKTTIELYHQIGYPVIEVCALTGKGLPELRDALQGRISVLVGKSGVGKSSLLNALQPDLGLRVQEVSRIKKGKHTTTHLEMFALDFGGVLVDTPGIREFGLWDLYGDELAACFPEMRPFLGQCKFRSDCRHDEEPGCAIRKAAMAGQINPLRYKSYMRLLEELP